jgi:hypothetical protein
MLYDEELEDYVLIACICRYGTKLWFYMKKVFCFNYAKGYEINDIYESMATKLTLFSS